MRKKVVFKHLAFVCICSMILISHVRAQSSTDSISSKQLDHYASAIESKVARTQKQIAGATDATISKLQRQEEKLYKKLYQIDSIAANNIFTEKLTYYKAIQQKANDRIQQTGKIFSGEYIPYLDTLTNSIAFIKEGRQVLQRSKELKEKISKVSASVNGLNNKIQQTEDIKKYIRERKEFLNQQLSKYTSLNKDLLKLNKTVFYYSQQIKGIKDAFNDPKKAEQKLLSILRSSKLFQDFMKRNSLLAGIFDLPSDYGTASLGNLQTRGQVDQLIQVRMNSIGPGAQQQMQQNIQTGQQQLKELKSKFPFLNESAEMPTFKKVNQEKGKTFLKRLELGTNFQFQRARLNLPNTSDIGLQLGYKLNQNSMISVGLAYKLGLGSGINNIQFTHQGIGLRALIDWRIKGGFYINGGYEQNYKTAFTSINDLKGRSIWQYTSLIGVSKKYQLSKKMKGNILLLFDLRYKQQLPQTSPFILRTGYNF